MRIRNIMNGKTWEIEPDNLNAGPNFRYVIGNMDPTGDRAFAFYAFTFAELARIKFNEVKLKYPPKITFMYDTLANDFGHIYPIRNVFVLEN